MKRKKRKKIKMARRKEESETKVCNDKKNT